MASRDASSPICRSQYQRAVEVFVTPPAASDTTPITSPSAARERGSYFHLKVVAHFAERAAGVTRAEVVHIPGHF